MRQIAFLVAKACQAGPMQVCEDSCVHPRACFIPGYGYGLAQDEGISSHTNARDMAN